MTMDACRPSFYTENVTDPYNYSTDHDVNCYKRSLYQLYDINGTNERYPLCNINITLMDGN